MTKREDVMRGAAQDRASGLAWRAGRKWFAVLALVAGIVLVAIGLINFARLLAIPPDGHRGVLALTVFPLVVGMSLFIVGIYWLRH